MLTLSAVQLARAIVPRQYYPTALQTYYRLRSLLYKGDRVICPCCERHFRKFRMVAFPFRKSAVCPGCGCGERHRLVWLYLKDKTNLFKDNLKLLHFAPEYIFQKKFVSLTNLDYISADLDSPLAMAKIDITNIPYDDNAFDVILCSHVLEHVMDDQKAMTELFRVLKPGGWAILQTPVDLSLDQTFEDLTIVSPKDRERFFGQSDHVRMYGRDYKDKLERAGFMVKIDTYVRDLGVDTITKYGLLADEEIYFCSKPKVTP